MDFSLHLSEISESSKVEVVQCVPSTKKVSPSHSVADSVQVEQEWNLSQYQSGRRRLREGLWEGKQQPFKTRSGNKALLRHCCSHPCAQALFAVIRDMNVLCLG